MLAGVSEYQRLAGRDVVRRIAGSAVVTGRLLLEHRLSTPATWVGARLSFADGTTSVVFRESWRDGGRARDPALLLVRFRLRWVDGMAPLHAVFRTTSIVNTPLFAGFPGFAAKLWLTDPTTGVYRGVYEWDRVERAIDYVEALERVLALVCVRGSVDYHVVPGVRRDEFLADPAGVVSAEADTVENRWWLLAHPVERRSAACRER